MTTTIAAKRSTRTVDRKTEWLCVTAFYVLAVAVYAVLAQKEPVPIVTPDEFIYGGAARSLINGDGLTVLGEPANLKAALYVYLIAPAWLLKSPEDAYSVAKVIGSVTVCLTVFPVWWLTRQFTSRWVAFIPAVLVVAGTWMTSAASILTENLALPLSAMALVAAVMALRRPQSHWIWWALGLSFLATWARLQVGVLFAILLVAVVLDSTLLYPRSAWRSRLERHRAPLAVLAALIVVGGIAVLAGGRSTLGFYESVTGYSPSLGDMAGQIGRQWISLTVMTAIIPMGLAVSAAATPAAWRDEDRLRPLLAVGLTTAVVFIVQSAWFNAGVGAPHAIQRYVVYAAPLLLITAVVVAQAGVVPLRTAVIGSMSVALLGFATPAVAKAVEERGVYGLWLRIGDGLGLSAGAAVGLVGVVAIGVTLALLWRARPWMTATGVGALTLAILLVQSQAGWKWQIDITRAFRAQYPSMTWLDDRTNPGVTRVFSFGNSNLTNNLGFFNTHVTQTLFPPEGYLGDSARGKQCELNIDASGVVQIAKPCEANPRQIWNNDPLLRLAFANGRRTADHPLLGQVFDIDGGPPRVTVGVILPCATPTLNISKDETHFGALDPAKNNCLPALRASTFLTERGTLVVHFAGGSDQHYIQVGQRSISIRPRQATTVRVPVEGKPARLQLPIDWTTTEGAPTITGITLEQGGTSTPVL